MHRLPLLLAALLLAPATLPSVHAASDDTDIIPIKSFDENEGFAYAYGTWLDQIQTTTEGVIIAGSATAVGGAGGELFIDIRRAQNLFVTLRKLPGHRAEVINIILMDHSGRGAGFVLGLNKVSSEWTTLQLDISRQSFRPPDMLPDPDWSAISGYQVQGNHSGEDTVAVQIRSICAAPPPPAAPL